MAHNLINDNSFRLVITAEIDGIEQSFEADIIGEPNVNLSSQISTQPLVSGDTMADHMFRTPTTISLSGTFSLNGNQPTEYTGSSDRLSSIQMTFERIMKEGIFCTLTTMNRANNSITRFMQRSSMVLTSISWTQKQNSLGFSFSFNEAITVEVYDDVEVVLADENLPALTDAMSMDFTDQFLDKQAVLQLVIKTLEDNDLLDSSFLDYFAATWKSDAGVIIGIGAVAATAVVIAAGFIAGAATVAGALVAAGPVGWVVGAAVLVAALEYAIIHSVVKACQKKKAEKEFVKAFKLESKNENKNKQEADRFASYLAQVYENLEVLEDVCQVYGIGVNKEQECMLYIDDQYYIFKFTKNNTTSKITWSCEVSDANGTHYKSINNMNSCITGLDQCSDSTMLLNTQSGYEVYLISLAEARFMKLEDAKQSLDDMKGDLTNYVIFVSRTKMSDFSKLLEELTINAMKRAS